MKKLKLSAWQDRGMEVLTRDQMKNVLGKMIGGCDEEGAGCEDTGNTCSPSHRYNGCNNSPEYGGLTCDYKITYSNCTTRDLCFAQCIGGDGAACMV